jgi:hypothetical protein
VSRNAFSHLSGADMGAGIDLEAVRGVFESGGADAAEAVTLAGCGPSVGCEPTLSHWPRILKKYQRRFCHSFASVRNHRQTTMFKSPQK